MTVDNEAIDAAIAGMIDHTLLKPDATTSSIEQLCREAAQYRFATVCVHPYRVELAARQLAGTGVGVTTVVGFPLGSTTSSIKAAEAREALAAGATEIDMVLNIGALKSGDADDVRRDIAAVVEACGSEGIVKVILETGYLTEEEKVRACVLCREAGAAFVKTSTGFGPGTATVEDVALMRRTVGPAMGVKAAGGIRDLSAARRMIAAGANRLGTSSGVAIVTGGTATGY